MISENLAERRKWYRIFPEGTLEFAIITRILALLLLMALAIVGGAQRPLVLMVLAGVLWCDYVLMLWWVVQVAVDFETALGGSGAGNNAGQADPGRRRTVIGLMAVLPSVGFFIAVVPWGSAVRFMGIESAAISGGLPIAGAVIFLVTLVPAFRSLKRLQLGSAVWTGLLLVPILHWVALHRVARSLDSRIRGQLQERGERKESQRDASLVLAMADATWVIAMLPWIVVVAVSLMRQWPASGLFKLGPVCGTCLAAVFAIVNLAAMEHVQSKLVALIKKA